MGKIRDLFNKIKFPGEASVYNVGDRGSIPGSGRSAGEGNGNPLQYYCLENPMHRGAWQATVHGAAKSRTRLSDVPVPIQENQRYQGNISCKDELDKGQKWYGPNRSRRY